MTGFYMKPPGNLDLKIKKIRIPGKKNEGPEMSISY